MVGGGVEGTVVGPKVSPADAITAQQWKWPDQICPYRGLHKNFTNQVQLRSEKIEKNLK